MHKAKYKGRWSLPEASDGHRAMGVPRRAVAPHGVAAPQSIHGAAPRRGCSRAMAADAVAAAATTASSHPASSVLGQSFGGLGIMSSQQPRARPHGRSPALCAGTVPSLSQRHDGVEGEKR